MFGKSLSVVSGVVERGLIGLPTVVIGGVSIAVSWLPIALLTFTVDKTSRLVLGKPHYDQHGMSKMREVGAWWVRNVEYTAGLRDEAEMFPDY